MIVPKRLKGKNVAHEHLQIAQSYVNQLVRRHAIAGIVLLGGAARGFADKHSDIDLAIFVDDKKTEVPRGEVAWRGYDVDHMVFHLGSWAIVQWTQVQRQAFSEGRILYDPRGRISRLLKSKLVFTEEERRLILVEIVMHLAWHGLRYRGKENWRGYSFVLPPDLWVKRGCPTCAHFVLDYCMDLLLQLLFAYNRRFIPDVKWRLYLAYQLDWLPKDFEQKVKQTMKTQDLTTDDFERRLSAFESLYNECVDKIASDKILPENLYRYFLSKSEDYAIKPTAGRSQTPNPRNQK